MRLGRKVDHIVDIGLGKNLSHQLGIAYVALDKAYPLVGNLLSDRTQIPGIGQFVQHNHINITAILAQQIFQEIGSNKTGCPGDQVFFHTAFLNVSQFTTFLRNNTTEHSNIVTILPQPEFTPPPKNTTQSTTGQRAISSFPIIILAL